VNKNKNVRKGAVKDTYKDKRTERVVVRVSAFMSPFGQAG
jgi:hypothetical protein